VSDKLRTDHLNTEEKKSLHEMFWLPACFFFPCQGIDWDVLTRSNKQ
jgi:hypothetical protein